MGTPDFSNATERDVEEAKEIADRGYGGADGVGILGVWYTADRGIFVLVTGMNVVVH